MTDKVAITLTSFAEYDSTGLDLLNKEGFKVVNNTFCRKLNKKETLKLCTGCVGVVAGTEIYDGDILGKLSRVKVISRCGAGTDNIDLDAAKSLGIKVFNTPNEPTVAVAELTIGLILALLRKISLMDQEIRTGLWKKRMSSLLSGKQVGIIGFGRIGKKVSELLRAIGANISYSDPIITEKETGLFPRMELKELLEKSDIISLHLSFSKENYKLMGQEELSLMKQGAFLINCSRGGIVDENALYWALKKGKLGGAAIDVFDQEPYNGRFKELDNVILTPHIGSYAKEARIEMEIESVKNLLAGLKK